MALTSLSQEADPQVSSSAWSACCLQDVPSQDKASIYDIKLLQLHTLKQQKAPEGHLRQGKVVREELTPLTWQVIEELVQTVSWDGEGVMELVTAIR